MMCDMFHLVGIPAVDLRAVDKDPAYHDFIVKTMKLTPAQVRVRVLFWKILFCCFVMCCVLFFGDGCVVFGMCCVCMRACACGGCLVAHSLTQSLTHSLTHSLTQAAKIAPTIY